MDHKNFYADQTPLKTCTFFDYLLQNSVVSSIFILDKKGTILAISQGVEKSYGYSPKDLIGKPLSTLFIEEDRLNQKPEIEIAKVLEHGHASDFNYIVHKDGSYLWSSGESVFVKDSVGEIYIVKNIQNINQEKILNESLIASEEKQNLLSEILNSEDHGIILFETVCVDDMIVDFEYVLVNKATEKLLNRKKEDLIGKKWLEQYPNMREVGIFDLQVNTMLNGKTVVTDFYYGYQNFNKWYKNKFIRVSKDKLLVTFDDITEQKLAHVALEEKVKERTNEYEKINHKLLTINEDLDKYAYVISHDLKAPLAAIEGMLPFLKEEYSSKPLDKGGIEMLEMIKTKTQDMRNLIDEVLKSAKQLQKSKVESKIYEITREVIKTLNPPEKVHILLQYPLPTVYYNRMALVQIMQNLISNAIKFTDKANPLIRITSKEFEEYHLICVEDNGPGIPQDKLEKIFMPFHTFDRRENIESHGLGLSIVKKLVEENGGKIWAESELGKMTVFHFTIPK